MSIAAKWLSSKVSPAHWLLSLLFLLVAVGLNYFRLPLFFSVEFIFCSTFAVLALLVLGRLPAIIVGCAAAAVTLAIWGSSLCFVGFYC